MSTNLTAVSLFAGILTGGFDEAMRRAGVHVAAAVEIDKDCQGVLRRQFPQAAVFNDVTEVTGERLRAAGFVPGRGILTAGWPCQGNSVAGRRKGMADPRSGLWRHVVRLLAETRPRWFIGENVPGLLSINGGRDFGSVIRDLDELGYGVAWRVLDAQFFGVPQRRRRVFLAGCLGDGLAPAEVLFEPESGDGNPASGRETRPGTSAGAGADAGIAGDARTLTAATLQGGGRRGHRIDAEGAAGGHLVPAVAETLRSHPRPTSNSLGGVVPVAMRGRDGGSQAEFGEPGDPAFTVRTPGGGSSYPMIAHALMGEGADASEDGTGRGTPIVTVPVAASLTAGTATGEGVRRPGRRQEDDTNLVAAPMAFNPQSGGSRARVAYGDKPSALQASQVTGVHSESAVRRLMPLECERLQGFPDDWTRWQDDGTEQSDSARYRQCGNAVAVPVVEWIARRVVAVDRAAEAPQEQAS